MQGYSSSSGQVPPAPVGRGPDVDGGTSTFQGATGGSQTFGSSAALDQQAFAILFISIAILLVGFFVIREATRAQSWLLGDRDGPSRPNSGVWLAYLWAILVSIIWTLRTWVFRGGYGAGPGSDLGTILLSMAYYPKDYIGGLLVAALIPNVIAVIKSSSVLLSWSAFSVPDDKADSSAKADSPAEDGASSAKVASPTQVEAAATVKTLESRPAKLMWVGTVALGLLSLAANIATLIGAFHQLPH